MHRRHDSLEGQVIPITTDRWERENESHRKARGKIQPPSPRVLTSIALALSTSVVHEEGATRWRTQEGGRHLEAMGSLITMPAHWTSLHAPIRTELLTGNETPVSLSPRRVIKNTASHLFTYAEISIFGTVRSTGATCQNALQRKRQQSRELNLCQQLPSKTAN